ncbi:hypothetical protein C6T58_19820 [Burkholderia multivorans]|uniref:hypothetical protein n=1 Tax=Burkholderia multivorans TaxID=87883 RepID=UPI0004F77166|nr:hypothetical protein [Burkholderia multivorans]AIO73751.1 hypothetical protein DM80_3644 [Burkholderia multivorans]PRE63098.1 hypothetical protein C6P86_19970 [Burkholderia multivorans]PRE90446.1 hypothetical protein C6Q00_03090 [Burkholderia multivorans]PRF56298.1 hypothetical protein C6Q11_04220 [Burkholderia multivorans]PRG21633.1 hypothetical protein C6T57_15930 [Burkholderia multivorans]
MSVVAFAAIFGGFAYIERDARIGHAGATHGISGAVGNAVDKTGKAVVAAVSGTHPASAIQIAQNAPPSVPASASASTSAAVPVAVANAGPASTPAALAAAPRTGTTSSHATTRRRDAHRPRTSVLASAHKRSYAAPKHERYASDAAQMEPATVSRDEVEGARALARARWCAQLDQWDCVEQNASRALAIDPMNSESRALLGQAIRNRL